MSEHDALVIVSYEVLDLLRNGIAANDTTWNGLMLTLDRITLATLGAG